MSTRNTRNTLIAILVAIAIGVAALILAVSAVNDKTSAVNDKTNSIQQSRERAAYDTCTLLKTLIYAASPDGKRKAGIAFIHATGLNDCSAYAARIIK